jgi:hypothetical protein
MAVSPQELMQPRSKRLDLIAFERGEAVRDLGTVPRLERRP